MTVLVSYVDFHADNHQGGSGRLFAFRKAVVIPDDMPASQIEEYVTKVIREIAEHDRQFNGVNVSGPVAIQGIEII